jgi:7-cyano-7-deazaguanine synthase in queuosine biosynthesis
MTPFDFTFNGQGSSEAQRFSAGEHFRFDIERIEDFFSCHLPSPMIDLLRIAMAVYVTDRLIRRRQREQERKWSRQITLKIGVLEPTLWDTDEIRNSLLECLEFLTDDTWDITFEQDDRRRTRAIQKNLFVPPPESRLCLFSAGLDSAAGLGTQLLRSSERPTIPITVWHQGGQKHNVEKQVELLRNHFKTEITPLIFKAHLLWGSRDRSREESTQRSRAFLFMAAGAAAAFLCRTSEVEVYESGVGAINLPLMAGMTGSRTTRSTHPEFLRRMSELVSTAASRTITFSLPFWENTKGQIVRNLANAGLHDLAKLTVSCVSYPLRDKKSKQCGICPACIFRRQAMLTAGITEAENTYKYDLFSATELVRQPSAKHLSYLKAFLMQIAELEQVQSGRRLPDRILRHLMGTGILDSGQSSAPFIRLFSEYRREWLDVAKLAERCGYSWTKLTCSSGNTSEGANRASA